MNKLRKNAAIAALRVCLRDHQMATSADIRSIATTYGFKRDTLRRWARDLECGGNPRIDERAERARYSLSGEALAVIAHYGYLKGAFNECQTRGLFDGSYRSFARAFGALDPAAQAGLLRGRKAMVALQPVMAYPLVGKNSIWVMDHTTSDVRTVSDTGQRVFRPNITIIRDKATSVVFTIMVINCRPNTETVVAGMAASMYGTTVAGPGGEPIFVGGRPEAVLVDNGGENTSDSLIDGLAELGVSLMSTTPGHSWQNGAAENIIGKYQREVEWNAPGYVRAGQGTDGEPKYVARTYDEQDVDNLLSINELRRRATTWAIRHNSTPGADGKSPLQRWAADSEPVEQVSMDEIRLAMLVSDKPHAVTKNGVHFRNREYHAADLAEYIGKGSLLTVRHLPGVVDWIEMFDGDRFIARAHLKITMPVSEQARIHARRRDVERQVRSAETSSLARRSTDAHIAAASEGLEPVEVENTPEAFGITSPPPPAQHTQKPKSRTQYGGGARSQREVNAMDKAADKAVQRYAPLPLGDDE